MRLRKRTAIIASVIFCAMVLSSYQSRAATNRLFGNMTYVTDAPYLIKKVTLVNGRHEARYGRLSYGLYYEGHYVYGDFNHDGLEDAAVIVSQGEGGSGDYRTLAFLINDGIRLVHQQSVELGDRAIIHFLRARDGKVVVDMCVYQQGDCMAGPTKHVRSVYECGGPRRIMRPQLRAST